MDNLTHSLVGVLIARSLPNQTGKDPKWARAAVWTAVIGSNFPDLDFVAQIVNHHSLSYLLSHRGYTHTLLFALPQGLLSAWIGARLVGWKGSKGPLGLLGWLSVLVHVFLDWCNSYGVHPFYPFSNRWFYGDRLFIVEPLLWFCLMPFVFHGLSRAVGRAWVFAFGTLILGLCWIPALIPLPVSVALSLWGALCVWLQRGPARARHAWGGVVAVLVAFSVGGHLARNSIQSILERMALGTQKIHQMSVSPSPSNPLCWFFVSLSSEQKSYIGRVGFLSLAPSFFSPEQCHVFRERVFKSEPEPLLTPVSTQDGIPGIQWLGEFRRPRQEFLELIQDCQFNAFLRFSRAPIWWQSENHWYVSDLRFGAQKGPSWMRIPLRRGVGLDDICPGALPPWEPPMHGVLEI